jgi:hypothetical protein
MSESARRRIAFAVPLLLSLGLSLSTVGSTLHWQDSGFFLSAVRETAVLYPPGFVLYLLLARAWTTLFFFLDFTLAVHLFSSACAAVAAAVLGRAAAALLRSRGPLFRVSDADPGPAADWAGAAIGCLAASGYTFWFSGLYAKVYALYFLVLALLLLSMIRADESGRPRDFSAVAALIGLAWQAHPSATLAGLGLLLFVGMRARSLGWKGLARRAALSAACAAAPVLLLPLLALGDAASSFDDPRGVADLWEYFTGRRFLTRPGSFGWEPTRLASVGIYGYEEFGVVGLVLLAVGLGWLARFNRRLLGWLLAWTVPLLEVTVLFLIEGQHDFWFVGAWIPLWLAAAAGVGRLCAAAGGRGALVAGLAGVAGTAAAVGANVRDLDLRGYDLAERHARAYLDSLEDRAILLVLSDDAAAGVHYLQEVRGEKRGVTLVRAAHLERGRSGEPSWYDRKILRRDPALRLPDYAAARARLGREIGVGVSIAAFLEANGGCERPVYLAFEMPPDGLPRGSVLSPAGALWKLSWGPEDPDPRHWAFAADAEAVAGRFRRARGQRETEIDHVDRLVPEAYERRLLQLMLQARRSLADWNFERGGWKDAAALYESIASLDPEAEKDGRLLFRRGECRLRRGEEGAEMLLSRALQAGLPAVERASAHVFLAGRARERGDEAGARAHLDAASAVRTLPDDVRERLERLRQGR